MHVLNNLSDVVSWGVLPNSFNDYILDIDITWQLDDFLITLKHIM